MSDNNLRPEADVVPVGLFFERPAETLTNVEETGREAILMLGDRVVGVLVPPEAYDMLMEFKKRADAWRPSR